MKSHYSMLIQWSDADQVYVVSLPEFGPFAKTHGATYAAAAKNGQEVLDLLTGTAEEDGGQLPEPLTLYDEPDLCKILDTHRKSQGSPTPASPRKRNGTKVDLMGGKTPRHAQR